MGWLSLRVFEVLRVFSKRKEMPEVFLFGKSGIEDLLLCDDKTIFYSPVIAFVFGYLFIVQQVIHCPRLPYGFIFNNSQTFSYGNFFNSSIE